MKKSEKQLIKVDVNGKVYIAELFNDFYYNILYSEGSIENMMSPVICNHCHEVYDLTKVKLIHRFQDCDMFDTPCCNKVADTRLWKSFPDYVELEKYNEAN